MLVQVITTVTARKNNKSQRKTLPDLFPTPWAQNPSPKAQVVPGLSGNRSKPRALNPKP